MTEYEDNSSSVRDIQPMNLVFDEILSFSLGLTQDENINLCSMNIQLKEVVEDLPQQLSGSLDCGLYMVTYAECLIFGEVVPSVDFDPDRIHTKYASLLWDYSLRKEEVKALNDDEAPMRPPRKIGITEDTKVHDISYASYVGGLMNEYFNVDKDNVSYFEMKDYIRELGYSLNCKFSIRPPNSCILGDIDNDAILLTICKTLQNDVVLDVYMHMAEEESCDAFYKDMGTTENSVGIEIGGKEIGEPYLKNMVGVALNTASNITSKSNPIAPNTIDPSDLVNHHIDSSDSDDSDYSSKGSDESSDNSTKFENEKAANLLGDVTMEVMSIRR
ncbi:hypothetical protein BC332_06989 [Capsicum chinense]|nr:hypothetical protein BC332_06989 [Capsicum chinense]